MPSNNNEITSYVKGEAIYVRVPVGLLVHSQTHRPEEPYRITDKIAMAEWIANNIVDYSKNVGDDEMGVTVFTVLIDQLFTKACEEGELWIEPIDTDWGDE